MSGPESQVIEYNPKDVTHWQDPELAQFYASRGEQQPTQEPIHEGIDQGFLHGLANYSTEPETAPQGHERGLDYAIGEGLGGSAYPAAGAFLGGLAGTLVNPGVGTALGAAGGGALGGGLYSLLRQQDLHKEQGIPDTIQNTLPRVGLDTALGALGPGESLAGKTLLGGATGWASEKGVPALEKHLQGQPVTWNDLQPGWGTVLGASLPAAGHVAGRIGERLGDVVGPKVRQAIQGAKGGYINKFQQDEPAQPLFNPGNVPATVPGQQPLQGRVIYEESPYVHQGEIVPEGGIIHNGEVIPPNQLPGYAYSQLNPAGAYNQPGRDIPLLPGQKVTKENLGQRQISGTTRKPLTTSEVKPNLIPENVNAPTEPNFLMGNSARNQAISEGIANSRQQLDELLNSVSKITERKALKQVLDRIEALRGQMQVNDPLTQRADSILRHYDRSPKR